MNSNQTRKRFLRRAQSFFCLKLLAFSMQNNDPFTKFPFKTIFRSSCILFSIMAKSILKVLLTCLIQKCYKEKSCWKQTFQEMKTWMDGYSCTKVSHSVTFPFAASLKFLGIQNHQVDLIQASRSCAQFGWRFHAACTCLLLFQVAFVLKCQVG
jgi:hypothetical protein